MPALAGTRERCRDCTTSAAFRTARLSASDEPRQGVKTVPMSDSHVIARPPGTQERQILAVTGQNLAESLDGLAHVVEGLFDGISRAKASRKIRYSDAERGRLCAGLNCYGEFHVADYSYVG
jgi:Tfp pilus assembly protein FimT